MNEFRSRFGQLLYDMLPSVYREQDNTVRDQNRNVVEFGDLARYLDGQGVLLDLLRGTLDQRLGDSFPDNPTEGRACQEWLIPYFARLLDVRLVSPAIDGQRDEVAHAVRWRQAKGTLVTAEEIAESITRVEVELQEGWQRVAITPRVGLTLLPTSVYGVMRTLDKRWVSQITRHPSLPAATVDFRCSSQAVQIKVVSPAVKQSSLGGIPVRWMQANPQGVPVAPGSFDDVSRRVADLRTPSYTQGHAHPRRLLVYTPIPRGLFPPPKVVVASTALRTSPQYVSWVVHKLSRELRIRSLYERPIVVSGDVQLPPAGVEFETIVMEGVEFRGKVTATSGALHLRRVTATEVVVQTAYYAPDQPVLHAVDCLLGSVRVPHGYAQFERCTVRRIAACGALLARNSLFAGALTNGDGRAKPAAGEIRRCRVPPGLAGLPAADSVNEIDGERLWIDTETCTTEAPIFFASRADSAAEPITPDCAVLTPNCPRSILFGADAGRELGAYNASRAQNVVVLTEPQTLDLANESSYILRDLVFAAPVTIRAGAQQPLRLERVAMSELRVLSNERKDNSGRAEPVLNASSSLFATLTVDHGLTRLEYCTVLDAASFAMLQASDCIFAGTLSGAVGGLRTDDCVRFSRVPPAVLASAGANGLHFPACTDAVPVFFETSFVRAVAGSVGGAVLHPGAPAVLGTGAEDGGELGAYHDSRYCLGRAALTDKLVEHLPVGVEPVLIPDIRLQLVPPAARNNN